MGKVLRETQQQTAASASAPVPKVLEANCVDGHPPDGEYGCLGRQKATSIEATLQERGNRYGQFTTHASITQAIKSVMRGTDNWARLAPDQQEALEMIAHKVGRILNGDPNYHDSWHDIVGYTKLVADRLAGKVQ
jgi:hypothetical protein